MLAVGISPHVAQETTEANFQSSVCPSCPTTIDPFHMNTIAPPTVFGSSPLNLPHEHFRSTGIRDASAPQPGVYLVGESNCLGVGSTWFLSNNQCLAETWDCDPGQSCSPVDGTSPPLSPPPGYPASRSATRPLGRPFTRSPAYLPAAQPPGPGTGTGRFHSNDVDNDKRPASCPLGTSGATDCPSQLHGAINFLFQEFCCPPGPSARCSRAEYRALWINGDYPRCFAYRSPSRCAVGVREDHHFGCARCLKEALSQKDMFGLKKTDIFAVERYCKCIVSKQLPERVLKSNMQYQHMCNPNETLLVKPTIGKFAFGLAIPLNKTTLTCLKLGGGSNCERRLADSMLSGDLV